jgi:hypothetical protein
LRSFVHFGVVAKILKPKTLLQFYKFPFSILIIIPSKVMNFQSRKLRKKNSTLTQLHLTSYSESFLIKLHGYSIFFSKCHRRTSSTPIFLFKHLGFKGWNIYETFRTEVQYFRFSEKVSFWEKFYSLFCLKFDIAIDMWVVVDSFQSKCYLTTRWTVRETGGCFVHFFWTIIKSRI